MRSTTARHLAPADPSADGWRVTLSRSDALGAIRATLLRHDRPVASARWHPHDPSGRLLWLDDDARDEFQRTATRLATRALPSCRRPVANEAASQLLIWMIRQVE